MINTFLRHAARSLGLILLLGGAPNPVHSASIYCITSFTYEIDDTMGAWAPGTEHISPPHCDTKTPYKWSKAIADSYWGTTSDIGVAPTTSSAGSSPGINVSGITLLGEWVYHNGIRLPGGYLNGAGVDMPPATIPRGSTGNAVVTFEGTAQTVTTGTDKKEKIFEVRPAYLYTYTDAYGALIKNRTVVIHATVNYTRLDNNLTAQVETPLQSCDARKGQCKLVNALISKTTLGANISIKPTPVTTGSVTSCRVEFPNLHYDVSNGEYVTGTYSENPKNDKFNVDIATSEGTGQCMINFEVSLQ